MRVRRERVRRRTEPSPQLPPPTPLPPPATTSHQRETTTALTELKTTQREDDELRQRYQAQLQQNLTYLAAIVDAQPQMYLLDTSNNLSQKRLSNNQAYTVDFVKSTWSKHYNA
ncbi:hypothetical protein RHMOL_Rhmol01G0222500 [Rhododendron molle]|uniref:Uncharacterized protein n=1 Tax=Rhododendron molle TaxID=49168 RepID=A0ACC0Q5M7_RHOML|nr:hypothetical protein RHMOL_Rhmol01G0222500 [Rhododendron molle]